MCGIFALLYQNMDIFDVSLNNSFMLGKKRGPEFSTFTKINDTTILFGFHRLAINGLDTISNQPITKHNTHLICNGEIYNYKQLIEQQGMQTTTHSDCEVISHAYHSLGPQCVSMLDGVFSFILYDEIKKQVMVARDPYGVRPLYMCYYIDGTIGFCSDIEPLLFNKNIKNIYNFPPGTYALFVVQNSKKWNMIHHERYFFNTSYILPITNEIKPIEYYMKTFVSYLHKAVQKRVENCEREIASLLSGGLDSSIISALVHRMYKEKTGLTLETYSIGLEGAEDLAYARIMSSHIGSNHQEIIVSNEDFIASIPEVIRHIESYDTTTVRASVGNWNIGKYIASHSKAKVIFNGDGSDELTGGYLYFHACKSNEDFHNETLRLLSEINRFDVLRSDKSISSHGLEPRTPFLDKELTRFYLSIPIQYRNHNETPNEDGSIVEKYFIRKAIELYDSTLLPHDILWRKKEAFSDGVSSLQKSWYEIIQDHMEIISTSFEHAYGHNIPNTKEQAYYRRLFEDYFTNHCSTLIPHYWMPNFVENATDASARSLQLYDTKSRMD